MLNNCNMYLSEQQIGAMGITWSLHCTTWERINAALAKKRFQNQVGERKEKHNWKMRFSNCLF